MMENLFFGGETPGGGFCLGEKNKRDVRNIEI